MADLERMDPRLRAYVDAYATRTTPAVHEVDAALSAVKAKLAAGSGTTAITGATTKVILSVVGAAILAVTALTAVRLGESPASPTIPVETTAAPTPEPIASAEPTPRPPARVRVEAPQASRPPIPPPAASGPAAQLRSRGSSRAKAVVLQQALPQDDATSMRDDANVDSDPVSDTLAAGQHEPSSEPESLVAELALLREARQALRTGNPARALVLARRHARDYPHSSFAEERSATEVMALCASGQREVAEQRAASFRRMYPGSVFDVGLVEACGRSG
ncbi:MAG: hypothetical protein L0206_26025 [Actinobacteria bacterium]|nr:hypothetical protein [Actinomycetota bacterium]